MKAGRNHLNEEITPLLPAGIAMSDVDKQYVINSRLVSKPIFINLLLD
jgi:hypothetical protein